MMTSLMWVNGNIVLRKTSNYYAEFRDETDRFNKKQEQMLDRRMRVLRRQERVSSHALLKTRYEAEQLRQSLRANKDRSLDLGEYDALKVYQRGQEYGRSTGPHERLQHASVTHNAHLQPPPPPSTSTSSSHGTTLPPIWGKNTMTTKHKMTPITQVAKPRRRTVNRSKLFVQCQAKALSLRALRNNKASVMLELQAGSDPTGSRSVSGSHSQLSGSALSLE